MTIDAYAAGTAAGRTLAMKHAGPAKAAPNGATQKKKPPASTLSPETEALLKQAASLARGDVGAQVAAIQGVQASERAAAQERARQIMLAAKAAAGLQTGIGDQTQAGFKAAAKDIAGMAQGFSGGLKDTASSEAQKVLEQLASVGATNLSPRVQGQGDALANVSYGLGGYLPASALLTGGTALAAAQRQLPASTLAYGGQESLGAIAAGENAAKAYDPKILDAQAGLPAAVRQYLSTLSGLKKDEFDQKLALAKYNTGIDQFNTRTGLQVGQFNVRTQIQKERLNLEAKRFAEQQFQSDRSYGIALSNLGISQAREQRQALAQEYKFQNGGFTKVQTNKFNTDAQFVASQVLDASARAAAGEKKKSGEPWEKPTPAEAMQQMYKLHVPLSIAKDALQSVYGDVFGGLQLALVGVGQKADPFQGDSGRVVVAPTANRAGVGLNPLVTSFVGKIAGIAGTTLTIGTGTNHNEYVKDSHRVSDHWNGNAADIPASGATLTSLGQDALIAAGADPAWARRQTGGLFNLNTPQGRVQVIFNSLEGGNHYNHLHVGING